MINIFRIIIIFVPPLRGSRQRRGATRERLKESMGKLVLACKFDPCRAQSRLTQLYFFFGLILASLWVWSLIAFVKRC